MLNFTCALPSLLFLRTSPGLWAPCPFISGGASAVCGEGWFLRYLRETHAKLVAAGSWPQEELQQENVGVCATVSRGSHAASAGAPARGERAGWGEAPGHGGGGKAKAGARGKPLPQTEFTNRKQMGPNAGFHLEKQTLALKISSWFAGLFNKCSCTLRGFRKACSSSLRSRLYGLPLRVPLGPPAPQTLGLGRPCLAACTIEGTATLTLKLVLS